MHASGRSSDRWGRLGLAAGLAGVLVVLSGCGGPADGAVGTATERGETPASGSSEEPGGCDVTALLGGDPDAVDEATVEPEVGTDEEPCLDTPPQRDG